VYPSAGRRHALCPRYRPRPWVDQLSGAVLSLGSVGTQPGTHPSAVVHYVRFSSTHPMIEGKRRFAARSTNTRTRRVTPQTFRWARPFSRRTRNSTVSVLHRRTTRCSHPPPLPRTSFVNN